MRHGLYGMPIQELNGFQGVIDLQPDTSGVYQPVQGIPDFADIGKKVAAGAVVLGFGYLAFKVFSSSKPKGLNGFDFRKFAKDNQDLLIKAGLVGAGYFLIVHPTLKAIGVIKSSEEKEQEKLASTYATSTGSPFNPQFYKTVPNAVLLQKESAKQLASLIYNAMGYFDDDEDQVYAVFRQLKAKTQVSWVAEIFYQTYGKDLYSFLSSRLSEDEMTVINQIVSGLK
jgi:hypothetical protein